MEFIVDNMNTIRRLWDAMIFTARYYRRLRVNGWRRLPALSRALEAVTMNLTNPDGTTSHLPPEFQPDTPVDNSRQSTA